MFAIKIVKMHIRAQEASKSEIMENSVFNEVNTMKSISDQNCVKFHDWWFSELST